MVDSAVVTVNGLEVTSPSDFDETVLSVVRSVSVADDNVLTVALRGDRGSGFTLQVVLRTSCTGNAVPVADVGADQTVFAGTLFLLDGGGSSHLEGAASTYGWSFLSKPIACAVMPTLMVDLPGT